MALENSVSKVNVKNQKIDINIPKVGSKFKSEDVFADMSVVNPEYIMGYVNQINPNAKKEILLNIIEAYELLKNNDWEFNSSKSKKVDLESHNLISNPPTHLSGSMPLCKKYIIFSILRILSNASFL